MKTRFESLYRLSSIFEELCDKFITRIRKNLMSIRKRIIENLKKNEMKYLLHINLTSRFQRFCVIYYKFVREFFQKNFMQRLRIRIKFDKIAMFCELFNFAIK